MDQYHQQPPGRKETERKARVTVDQYHQQSPGGKETERKARVTVDQRHQQPPGGKETERKARVTVDPLHQQPPEGNETERKARVTVDQRHQQPPGGNTSLKDVIRTDRNKNRTEWRTLISNHADRSSSVTRVSNWSVVIRWADSEGRQRMHTAKADSESMPGGK